MAVVMPETFVTQSAENRPEHKCCPFNALTMTLDQQRRVEICQRVTLTVSQTSMLHWHGFEIF